jgi:hypothetical protein
MKDMERSFVRLAADMKLKDISQEAEEILGSVKNQLGNRNWLRKYNPEVATSEIRGAAEAIINLSYEVEDLINQYISGDSGD